MDWERNKIVRVRKNFIPTLSRLWTKVHEIMRCCMGLLVLSSALSDCPCLVSFRRYLPLILQVVDKLNKCVKFFGSHFFGRDDPDVLVADYCPPFGKALLSSELCLLISICEAWQWSRMQNLWRVGKRSGPILSCLWAKVHDILRRCRRPLFFPAHLTIMYIMFHSEDIGH